MGQLLTDLGNKQAGQLIRHDDWNRLVAALDGLEENLVPRVTSLESTAATLTAHQLEQDAQLGRLDADITEVRGNLEQLTTRLDEVSADLATWVDKYLTLTLKTTAQRYPVGAAAQVEARLANVRGEALDLSDSTSRPWIDFVASWGLLKPAPGFVSRGGVGERSISVQVNGEGVARILVRAEHGEGLSEEDELQVTTVLTGQVPGTSQTMNGAILEAATPVEAFHKGAFRLLSTEYDRKDVGSLRRYVDNAYLKTAPKLKRELMLQPIQGWRDHRTAVFAFAKADGDPTTADHCSGCSSIEITFRDWTGPFVHLQYLSDLNLHVTDLVRDFRANLGSGLKPSVENFKRVIKRRISDRGSVGRLRDLSAVTRALDQLDVESAPSFLPVLKQSIRDAVNIQQSLDSSQMGNADGDQDVVLDVFANTSLRADESTAEIGERVGRAISQLDQVKAEFEGIKVLEKEVLKYDTRPLLTQLRADFDKATAEVEDLKVKVVKLDVRGDIGRLQGLVGDLSNGIKDIDQKVGTVRGQVVTLDNQTKQILTSAQDLKSRQADLESKVGNFSNINVRDVNQSLGLIGSLVNRVDVLERK